MFRREDIRYHAWWVRLVGCLAVAIGVANAVHFNVLAPLEYLFRSALVAGEIGQFAYLARRVEILLVFGVCLGVSVPRFDRPITMLACGAGFVLLYEVVVLAVLFTADVILPMVSPVLGLVTSTALLETMAWSEERARRTGLEDLEQARQQFTDMLVHDIRNRMSTVLTSSSLLQKRADGLDAGGDELVTAIRAGTERMLTMVNDLLDIRKMQESSMDLRRERVPLGAALAAALRDHQAAAGLACVRFRSAGDQDPAVRADRRILARVLANLLWNALQHAPQGSEIETGCALDGDAAVLHIANRGEPIPPQRKALIFRAFAGIPAEAGTQASEGAGLGLSFCKLAMEAHGGAIAVESPWQAQGDGVKVELRFPLADMVQARNVV